MSAVQSLPVPTARRWVGGVVGVVVLILGWQAAVVVFSLPDYVLPSPVEVVTHADWPAVLAATTRTALAALIGFAIGNLTGFGLAVLAASSQLASGVVQPLSVTLRSIPIVAIAPLLTLFFGRGILVTIVVAALVVFFPTLVNVMLGLRATEREVLELFRILNCSATETFRMARLPGSMPYLFAALRIAAPGAVLGVMVAEWVVGGNGLGQLILSSAISLEYATLWASVIASTVLAGLMFTAVAAVERVAIPWEARR